MKLISCISRWLDRPDLEIRSVDDVTNVRDEEGVFSFLRGVFVGCFSGETLEARVELRLLHGCRQMELMRRKRFFFFIFLMQEGLRSRLQG